MSPPPRKPIPPANNTELLRLLRRCRTLDQSSLRRVSQAWNPDDPPASSVAQLVQAGLLTPYQAQHLLAGRSSRLRLGPYRLLEQLGEGGMGQVFKAEHLLLKRIVALKVLGRVRRRPRSPSAPPTSRQPTESDPRKTPRVHSHLPTQYRQEIETTGQLSHPNLVLAHDACRIRGKLVLVLEYIEGVDLERLVQQTGPLPLTLACEAIRQTARALAYLHERHLVHRDVKPANIVLAQGLNGEPPVVKLLDLGLACRHTQPGEQLCGTPDYLAPERGMSAQHNDIRSDLYSLGCTFYRLLTGRVPYPGGSWMGKLLRHRIEIPTPVCELRPDVPAGIAAIVEKLMARDPSERFATPEQVLLALERATTPVPSSTTSLPQKAKPSQRSRHQRPLLVLLALVAALLGTSVGTLARRTLASGSSGSSPRKTPPPNPPPFDLVRALDQAQDGDVIPIPPGRYLLPSIQLHGKRLTLRAASETRPILVSAGMREWEPLIQSDRDLTLQGLECHGGPLRGPPVPLIQVQSGQLLLRHCVLTQPCQAPALSLRQGSCLQLEHTHLRAFAQGLSVEAPISSGCQIRLLDSELQVREATGAALVLWQREQAGVAPFQIELHRNKIQAGRILGCRSLGGRIRLHAEANHLVFHQAFLSFDGYHEQQNWRDRLHWHSRDNRYQASGPWLLLEGKPTSAWDEQAFAKLWNDHP